MKPDTPPDIATATHPDSPRGWSRHAVLHAATPEETDALARRLAEATAPGDTLLLSGDLGAGKSHFARAFIRHALGPGSGAIDVPSPSFTLVQTYQTEGGEIWHADLYRLSGQEEALELGLDDAMRAERCLIEWPERFDPDWPETAVMLRFDPDAENSETGRMIGLWAAREGDTLRRVLTAWPPGDRR